MDTILIYPIAIPLVASLICLLLPRRARLLRELLVLATILVMLGLAIYISRQPELQLALPWFTVGTTFEVGFDLLATPFAKLALIVAAVFSLLVAIYSLEFLYGHERHGEYFAYLLASLGMAAGAVLANNLVVLLLFWELLGFLLYLMIMISGSQASNSASKALIIAVTGDMALLLGIAFIWIEYGTLTLSDLTANPLVLNTPTTLAAYILFLVAAFAKAGVIPLHTWIPEISTHAMMPVMSYFTSLDKLVGIYLLASMSLAWFIITPAFGLVLMVFGAVTLLAGVLMAMIQSDFRKMLAFHNVSQVGYMVLGIGTGMPLGIIGGIFHMLNMIILKGNLFLCCGSVQRQTNRTNFSQLGGLSNAMPWTFACTWIASLGIAGVPPLNAFVSKWLIYQGIISMGGGVTPIFVLVAMFGSALTLASFMKLMYSTFWGELPEGLERVGESRSLILIPQVVLAATAVLFGIFYLWPVQNLIMPLFSQTATQVEIPGFWDSGLAAILMILSLLVGIPIYLLSRPKGARETEVFVGGEALPSELYRVRGTHFYGPVKEFKGLRKLYALGEAGSLDLYNYMTRFVNWGSNIIYEYFDQALADFYQEVIPSFLALGGQILRLLNRKLVLTYLMWILYIAALTGMLIMPDNQAIIKAARFIACIGMVVWGILAWVEIDLRRLLVLATTSQLGFVLLGFTLSPDVALYYLITGSLALAALFLLTFSISRSMKTTSLDGMNGLAARMPVRFLLFLIAALWLSGLPPFGSFFSKYLLGVAAGEISPILTIVITGSALLTLGYLLRPIQRFLRPA